MVNEFDDVKDGCWEKKVEDQKALVLYHAEVVRYVE